MHPGEGREIGQLMGVEHENALELCTCSLVFYRPTGSMQLVETTTYTEIHCKKLYKNCSKVR